MNYSNAILFVKLHHIFGINQNASLLYIIATLKKYQKCFALNALCTNFAKQKN